MQAFPCVDLDGDDDLGPLRSALCSPSGLFFLLHGAGDVDSLFPKLAAFFEQDEATKLASVSQDRARRGYSPCGSENFASLIGQQASNDSVEKFRIGPPPPADPTDPYYASKAGRVHFFPNVPCATTDLLLPAHASLSGLALRLLQRIDEALCPPSPLGPAFRRHTSILTANYYPPLSSSSSPSIHPHTDVSLFTLIVCSGPGLQVWRPHAAPAPVATADTTGTAAIAATAADGSPAEGEWVDVVCPPGACVVTLGDCLSECGWARRAGLSSCLHRVVPSSAASPAASPAVAAGVVPAEVSAAPAARQSVALFASPAWDARLGWAGEGPGGGAAKGADVCMPAASEAGAGEADRQGQGPGQGPGEGLGEGVGVGYAEWRAARVKRSMRALRGGSR